MGGTCAHCGEPITARLLNTRRRYCSLKCRHAARDARFRDDLKVAEIERRFTAAKAHRNYLRRIAS